MKKYIRAKLYRALWENLHNKPNFIQVINGPRQVGKTTIALQIFDKWTGPKIYQTADNPNVPSFKWISDYWMQARELAKGAKQDVLLIFDEIQNYQKMSF